MTDSLRCLGIFISLILLTSACTHTDIASPMPQSYQFPPRFYVEQTLELKSHGNTQYLLAQLERKADAFTVVLLDRTTSIVLAKLKLQGGEKPEAIFISPAIARSASVLPWAEIGESIEFLYRSPLLRPTQGEYILADKAGRWTYAWHQFTQQNGCLFPKSIRLNFKEKTYALNIELNHLECE